TSRADRMASASGVSNGTGLSTFGIFAALMRSSRAGSPPTLAGGSAKADGGRGDAVTARRGAIRSVFRRGAFGVGQSKMLVPRMRTGWVWAAPALDATLRV